MSSSRSIYYSGFSKRNRQKRIQRKKLQENAKNIDVDAIVQEYLRNKNPSSNIRDVVEETSHFQHISNDQFLSNFDETSNLSDPIENLHEDNFENSLDITIIESNNSNDDNSDEQNEDLVYTSLLTLFYSTNMTQDAFKLVIEHTQLFTNISIPKSFNALASKVVQNQSDLNYKKVWYCQSCSSEVKLVNSKQRMCSKCKNK